MKKIKDIVIEAVSAYPCPLCKVFYESEQQAKDCLADCQIFETKEAKRKELEGRKEEYIKELEAREMILCTETENFENFPSLLVKYAKEYLDVEIEIVKFTYSFKQMVSNDNGCPKGGLRRSYGSSKDVPLGYPGYEGTLEFKILNKEKFKGRHYIEQFMSVSHSSKSLFIEHFPKTPPEKKLGRSFESGFPHHLYGLHNASNNGWGPNVSFTFRAYIDDFPKIKAKYDVFSEKLSARLKIDEGVRTIHDQIDHEIVEYLSKHEKVLNLNQMLKTLEKSHLAAKQKANTLQIQIKNGFTPKKLYRSEEVKKSSNFDFEEFDKLHKLFPTTITFK